MSNRELLKIIGEIKNCDMRRFSELYEAFEMLIRHFERKSDFDDAAEELTLFLLELIYSVDTDKFFPDGSQSLNRYIAVSLRNRYIQLSKKRGKHISELGEMYDGIMGYSFEPEENLLLKEGLALLSERQRTAVLMRHIYGYSDAEIADRLGITRQAVNRLEARGLKTLKAYFGI